MLKIGDFSTITQISVRMLRYYDEIGLLRPAKIDPITGYRFYKMDQIVEVNKISALKEIGFTLSEIYNLVTNDMTQEQLVSIFEDKQKLVMGEIEKERRKLRRLEALIRITRKDEYTLKYNVVLRSVPESRIAFVRDVLPSYQEEGLLWQELQEYCRQNCVKSTGQCYAIYHDPGYKERDVDVEVTMSVIGNIPETDRIRVRTLEAVPEMAVIMHKGPFEEMTQAYHALGHWLEANRYEICGPTRAIYHKGPWCEDNPADYLTEIQAPVTKTENK